MLKLIKVMTIHPQILLDSNNVINGAKTLVLNAANADSLIVTCTKENKLHLVLIDSNIDGVSIIHTTVDGQSCSEISFENVKVDDSNILSTGEEAESLIKETINLATLCISAEAVGLMESCYLKTFEYTKGREQFGYHSTSGSSA